MAPWLVAAAMAMQKMQEKKAKDQARSEARSSIAVDRASAMGYPVYGAQAQAQKNEIDQIEGPNYLGMLMDEEERKRKQSGNEKAQLGGGDYFKAFTSS